MRYRKNKNTLVYERSSTGKGYFVMERCPKSSSYMVEIKWETDKGKKKSMLLREWEGLLMLDGLSTAIAEKNFKR